MSKGIKRIASVALPIAGAVFGGPAGAALGGAAGGAIGGGGLKGALLGGAGGYLAGGGLGSIMGTPAGAAFQGPTMSGAPLSAVSKGSGILGSLGGVGRAINSVTGLGGTLAGGGSNLATALSSGLRSVGGGLLPSGGGSGLGIGNTALNIFSGIQGTAGAKTAAQKQLAANNKALALQSQTYQQNQANLNPFMTSGTAAGNRLSDLLGVSQNTGAEGFGDFAKRYTPEDLTNDPGYQFRLAEGTKAINQSLGAKGGLFSGQALKEAQNFGQGLADQTYNDAYRRYVEDQQRQYNQLSGQQGVGLNAAGTLADVSQNYAANAGNLYGTAGDIAANRVTQQGNVLNQSLANIMGTNVGGFTGGYVLAGYDASGQPIYKKA